MVLACRFGMASETREREERAAGGGPADGLIEALIEALKSAA